MKAMSKKLSNELKYSMSCTYVQMFKFKIQKDTRVNEGKGHGKCFILHKQMNRLSKVKYIILFKATQERDIHVLNIHI